MLNLIQETTPIWKGWMMFNPPFKSSADSNALYVLYIWKCCAAQTSKGNREREGIRVYGLPRELFSPPQRTVFRKWQNNCKSVSEWVRVNQWVHPARNHTHIYFRDHRADMKLTPPPQGRELSFSLNGPPLPWIPPTGLIYTDWRQDWLTAKNLEVGCGCQTFAWRTSRTMGTGGGLF